ncbi:MAG: hypothetical protein IJJ33_21360 [Victivallales bacterium]|nr:hypothetical protein [Victivallales bacterium]
MSFFDSLMPSSRGNQMENLIGLAFGAGVIGILAAGAIALAKDAECDDKLKRQNRKWKNRMKGVNHSWEKRVVRMMEYRDRNR